MTTAARPTNESSAHWYTKDGQACYEVPRASGEGMRATTLADARKLNLLPSVTTILGVLHKEALVQWKVEQAVLACMTSPKQDGESLDEFTKRILHTERVQDQESDIAKKRGTEIHDALEEWAKGFPITKEMEPWIGPVATYLGNFGCVFQVEKILVSEGYAGRTDLIQERYDNRNAHIWDFKTCKKVPTKGSWKEHVLQLSAYANAFGDPDTSTGNIYISTVNPGEFSVFENDPWHDTYENGFTPLVKHWQWANNYHP